MPRTSESPAWRPGFRLRREKHVRFGTLGVVPMTPYVGSCAPAGPVHPAAYGGGRTRPVRNMKMSELRKLFFDVSQIRLASVQQSAAMARVTVPLQRSPR